MDLTQLIGFAATVASVTSFTPQAYKIVKTRDTSGISSKMYTVTVIGFALWLTYGLRLGSWPLIVTNGLCLALSAFILFMTLAPRDTKEKVADKLDVTSSA